MIRALVVGALCLLIVGGCGALDRALRNETNDAKAAEGIQKFAAIVETATALAHGRGYLDDATAETLTGYAERAQRLASEGNVTLARMMLLQIVGELPAETVAEAEGEVGATVADEITGDG